MDTVNCGRQLHYALAVVASVAEKHTLPTNILYFVLAVSIILGVIEKQICVTKFAMYAKENFNTKIIDFLLQKKIIKL